jgi:anti-sigma factor RsiW
VTCEQLTAFIADYLAGELDAETTLAFEEHLLGCSECISFLNTYRKTIDAIRSLRNEDIPPEMQDRVRRFLDRRLRDQGSRRIRQLIWKWIKHASSAPVTSSPALRYPLHPFPPCCVQGNRWTWCRNRQSKHHL